MTTQESLSCINFLYCIRYTYRNLFSYYLCITIMAKECR